MLRVLGVGSVLALVALLSCTAFKVDPDFAYACSTDADCAGQPGRACVDGHCRAPAEVDGGVDAGCTPKTCADLGQSCGSPGDGCGGTLHCGECGVGLGCGARGDARVCEACEQTDPPDDAFIDSNCDGIDGVADASVFVDDFSGDDVNPGTREQPFKTVQKGIAAATANGMPVLVSTGTYDGLSVSSATKPVSIYGGYDASKGWARANGNAVTITVQQTGAQISSTTAAVVLDRVRIHSADAAADGSASIALVANTVTSLSLNRVELRAGSGAKGADSNLAGMQGGTGGAGGTPFVGTFWNPGAPASSNCPGGAGAGGGGGAGGNPGQDGASGQASPGGGAGGDGGTGVNGPNGGTPTDGANGAMGPSGAPGANGDGGVASGTWIALSYVPAAGEKGQPGGAGAGGGGGGGGGGLNDTAFNLPGGGGGGGGSGGCGGTGGGGGGGGGASVALLSINSNVSFDAGCILETKFGGQGGSGAPGGAGGSGGPGGKGGAPGSGNTSGSGGDGANGASGGPGGAGGGGGGGPSVGVWCVGSSSVSGTFTTALGAAGKGGQSPGIPGADGTRADTIGCQ